MDTAAGPHHRHIAERRVEHLAFVDKLAGWGRRRARDRRQLKWSAKGHAALNAAHRSEHLRANEGASARGPHERVAQPGERLDV